MPRCRSLPQLRRATIDLNAKSVTVNEESDGDQDDDEEELKQQFEDSSSSEASDQLIDQMGSQNEHIKSKEGL